MLGRTPEFRADRGHIIQVFLSNIDGVSRVTNRDVGRTDGNAGEGHGGGVHRGGGGHGVGVAEGVSGATTPAILCIAERAAAERPSSSIPAVRSGTQRTILIPQIIVAVLEGVAVVAARCGPQGG